MPLEAHTFLKGRSNLSYFLRLNYNFRTALKKSVKQHLLVIAIYPRKTGQNLHSFGKPVRNNSPLKTLKSP